MSFTEIEFNKIGETYDLDGYFNGTEDDQKVRVFEGDLEIESIDLLDGFSYLVIGNLTVKGNIDGMDDEAGFLFVTGNCHAKNVLIGGPEVWIKGDLNVGNGFLADYNHGCITVEGDVNARIVLAEHSVRVGGSVNGISVDFGGFEVKDVNFKATHSYDSAVMNATELFAEGIVDGGVSGFKIYQALKEGRDV